MIAGLLILAAASVATPAPVPATPPPVAPAFRERLPQDEVIYLVMPDRFENGDPSNDQGGLTGDRLKTGFDPAGKGFYHGGDLKGLIRRLDYIEGLGATAIWLTPVLRNKPVQGAAGDESAGYHGYWITDFTHVDPHLGTDADYKAFVDAAHARGMKVYFDIVVNHTADVIQYRECLHRACPYRSLADYPYSRQGGVNGPAINPGFLGDGTATPENFAKLQDMRYAYTPFLASGDEHAKAPEWLNDIRNYHNRGNSTFEGESSTYGDFVGLDDVATERPQVLQGFIDVYGAWIDAYGIDGFRIDTSKHVDRAFWPPFVAAMTARAKAKGISNFQIFAEVMTEDSATQARYAATDRYDPEDFTFAWTMVGALSAERGTDTLTRLFADDAIYPGGSAAAQRLPTFLGNYDIGRFATLLRQRRRDMSDAELLARVRLGHALLLTMRGAPVIYYGDEQGFNGDGGDQDAREDMFASKVPSYLDNPLLGSAKTHGVAQFDAHHPLYTEIAALARLRRAHPALRRGTTDVRADSKTPGLFVVARVDRASGEQLLLAFNTSQRTVSGTVAIDPAVRVLGAVGDACRATLVAPGSMSIQLPPLGYAICSAK